MASLSLLIPFWEYWYQLREGARDNIIGGLIVAVIVGVAVVFRNSFILVAKRLVGKNSSSVIPPHHQRERDLTDKPEGLQPSRSPVQLSVAKPLNAVPNIPRPPIAGFVARRDTEGHDIMSRLAEELNPEGDQLIVLWGAGGVGKTTLAAEAARSLRQSFGGRILWISAEGRPDFTLSTLLDEIATYLGRTDLRQLALAVKDEQVHDALGAAPTTLIVLDNFETVGLDEQDRCSEWLAKRASCPALVTSRDEVAHARPIHILAMSLPEAREFLQHLLVQARNPRAFEGLDRERIIQAADRIPLVLQWVVKQIDSAKQPQVVLNDLSHGEGDAAKRVFDRSFDLPQVGDDGRAVLLALSLFVPSASRSALAEVAGFGTDTKRLDLAVQQLGDLWLIQATEGNERLSVEGLTRDLAKARLAKDEHVDDYRRQFVANALSYAKAHAEPRPEDYDALEAEKDNLLTAMDVAFDLNDGISVIQLMDSISFDGVRGYLPTRGYWEETIRRGEQALKAAHNLSDESQIARFSHNLAITYQRRGDWTEARRLYNQSLEISKQLGKQGYVAALLHQLAMLEEGEGDSDEARRLYEESLEISKSLGNDRGIALTLHELGILAQGRGDPQEARRLYNNSLKIEKKLGNQSGIGTSLFQLGRLAQEDGELDEARQLYNESLGIKKIFGDQSDIAIVLNQLGRLAEIQGDGPEAARLFREALTIFERLKAPHAMNTRQNLERVEGKPS